MARGRDPLYGEFKAAAAAAPLGTASHAAWTLPSLHGLHQPAGLLSLHLHITSMHLQCIILHLQGLIGMPKPAFWVLMDCISLQGLPCACIPVSFVHCQCF